jgi:hypothetical protein
MNVFEAYETTTKALQMLLKTVKIQSAMLEKHKDVMDLEDIDNLGVISSTLTKVEEELDSILSQ